MTEEQYRKETLTIEQVSYQLDQHGVLNHNEFFDEIGHKSFFTGSEVLNWLGY